MGELSAYEQKALAACVTYRDQKLREAPAQMVPGRARRTAAKAAKRVKDLPGAERVGHLAASGADRAVGGLVKAVDRVTDFTLDPDRVVATYRAKGVDVDLLEDVRHVDLQVLDRAVRLKKMRSKYAYAAMVEGGATGLAITGGQVAATVGGAPGVGAVLAVSAADAAASFSLASHVVSHTALHFGYDPSLPEEEVFRMSVIGAGMAVTQSAKAASFSELYKLTMMLARKATWETLNSNVVARLATKFAAVFGEKLTKRKLGQFVPFIGVGLGAGANFTMIDAIGEAAYWAYRERFLRDKLGDEQVPEDPVTDVDVVDETEEPILVLELLDDLEQDTADEPPSGTESGR